MTSPFRDTHITLAHGGGGEAMRRLIESVIAPRFQNTFLAPMEDQARLPMNLATGERLAFTTDAYVVDPLFFPGGDIGLLAINGTVNDLVVGGAIPLYLTCSLIMEEGLEIATLERVLDSMQSAALAADVQVVAGDTKVVPRGAADKLFITTSGIGVIPAHVHISASRAQHGDVVLVSGHLGDHGAAVLKTREGLQFEADIHSDTQALYHLVQAMLTACPDIHSLRDATRGGVAAVLNEWAQAAQVEIRIDDNQLPVRTEVRALCEILGIDPLYLANEGLLVALVPPSCAEGVLRAMRDAPGGTHARRIGVVGHEMPGRVTLNTAFGGVRMVDRLEGEQLPRIC